MAWISVRNWGRFQHYDPAKRAPIWIKNYNELLHDDAYLGLSSHRRGLLHGLWLEYASSRCRLRLDTASLSSRLRLRVTTADIESLNHAGFIDIVASKTLADGYQDASPEVEVEEEEELPAILPTEARPPAPEDNNEQLEGRMDELSQNGQPEDHDTEGQARVAALEDSVGLTDISTW